MYWFSVSTICIISVQCNGIHPKYFWFQTCLIVTEVSKRVTIISKPASSGHFGSVQNTCILSPHNIYWLLLDPCRWQLTTCTWLLFPQYTFLLQGLCRQATRLNPPITILHNHPNNASGLNTDSAADNRFHQLLQIGCIWD